MQDQSLFQIYHFVTSYPIAVITTIGFAVLHHWLANRFRCFGFVRNVAYGIACAAVSVGLFFVAVLAIRHLNISSRLTAQLIGGFMLGALIIVGSRLLFPPKAPATASSTVDNEAAKPSS